MLFKRKDNSDSTKAKAAVFAAKGKGGGDALDLPKEASKPASKKQAKKAQQATFKQVTASGKVSPDILVAPRITEKASDVTLGNVYVFDIAPFANKILVTAAIKDVYGITPKKVRITKVPKKSVRGRRGQMGSKGGGKKAYVYLKAGDTIELI